MPKLPRRSIPFLVAIFCWIIVFFVPLTRQSVFVHWTNNFGLLKYLEVGGGAVYPYPDEDELLREFPNTKEVQYLHAQLQGADSWLQKEPNDAYLLSLVLREKIKRLRHDRYDGPLTNPNYLSAPPTPTPVSPHKTGNGGNKPVPPISQPLSEVEKEQWNEFIALARRGQKLEPENTYFDWMLLYGLYATRQDNEARTVLRKAATKTKYDDFEGEFLRSRMAIIPQAYGRPYLPTDESFVLNSPFSSEAVKFRQIARWCMETVIFDRKKGDHTRALNSAFDMVRLGRTMRRESRTIIGSLLGQAYQAIAVWSVSLNVPTATKPKSIQVGAPLSSFQSHPRSLYSYAKSQNRSNITRMLEKEWVELGQSQKLIRSLGTQNLSFGPSWQIYAIILSERLKSLIVSAMPVILIVVLFTAFISKLCHRTKYEDSTLWIGGVKYGAGFGIALWFLAMTYDMLSAIGINYQQKEIDFYTFYAYTNGLIETKPYWLLCGVIVSVICLGINRSVAWQMKQAGKQKTLRSRFKSLMDAPEDGIARFDFSWIFILALRLTVWILIVGGILLIGFSQTEIFTYKKDESVIDFSVILMALLLFGSVLLSIAAWLKLPYRRQTLALSPHIISSVISGFFVLTSVLYALVTFAILPATLNHEAKVKDVTQRGEIAHLRSKMGL
jgi:hypothetical protein